MLRIVIDAGHGHNTPGKRVPNDCFVPNAFRGIREWDLNQKIADLVIRKLAPYDVTILRTDDYTGDSDPSLARRRTKANKFGAELFLSIHHNAGLKGRSGGGVTVAYHSMDACDPVVTAHATHLYNAVIMHCQNRGNRATPIHAQTLGVLNASNKAKVKLLIECGFMDGPLDEIQRICDPAYADQVAQGIAEYIIGAWGAGLKEA